MFETGPEASISGEHTYGLFVPAWTGVNDIGDATSMLNSQTHFSSFLQTPIEVIVRDAEFSTVGPT